LVEVPTLQLLRFKSWRPRVQAELMTSWSFLTLTIGMLATQNQRPDFVPSISDKASPYNTLTKKSNFDTPSSQVPGHPGATKPPAINSPHMIMGTGPEFSSTPDGRFGGKFQVSEFQGPNSKSLDCQASCATPEPPATTGRQPKT
jgi:hypothetical protein